MYGSTMEFAFASHPRNRKIYVVYVNPRCKNMRFTIHVTVLILLKGVLVLFARSSRLIPDKAQVWQAKLFYKVLQLLCREI
jgi:hypothetical protein